MVPIDDEDGTRRTPDPWRPRPLEEIKPPREWQSVRHDPARAVPAPRVVKQVASAQPAPPAGSQAPPGPSPVPASVQPAATPAVSAPLPVSVHAASDDLPWRYDEDRLVLLVRDPYWVYAWWELQPGTLASGRAALGAGADLVLRVYDISGLDWNGTNHHSHFDIGIEDLGGNWYVELGKPGASFCAEVGLRAADGRFLALVRSNVVTLPRDAMSQVVDEEWMIVEEDFRRLFDLAGGADTGLGSGEIARMLEQRLRSELASGGVSSFGLSSPAARPTAPATRPTAPREV